MAITQRTVYIVLIFITLSHISMAQHYQLPDSIKAYGDAVSNMLQKTNDSTYAKAGRQFAGIWYGTSFSKAQQDTLMAASAVMQKKNYNTVPYLADYYETLVYAVDSAKLSQKQMTDLLGMLLKTVQHYDRRQYGNAIGTLKQFLKYQALYYANYNKVYVDSKDFSFSFVDPPKDVIEAAPAEESAQSQEDVWGDPDQQSTDQTTAWDALPEDEDWNSGWGDTTATETPEEKAEEKKILEYIVEDPEQPVLEGPLLHFNKANLAFITPFDSASLVNTKGDLILTTYAFVGEEGKFNWQMAGLSADSVFYTLNKYNFDIRTPKLSAENGLMTYKGKIDKPVKGMFQFASQRHASLKDVHYPRFKSYDNNIKVHIFNSSAANPNTVAYLGGFSLEGRQISSSSLLEDNATVEVKDQKHKKFKAVSGRFNIGDSLITSKQASITIYQRGDSIYHPAVELKYILDSARLTVLLGDGALKNTPFTASYVNMDITADVMRWDLRTDSINIATLAARDKVPVVFESHDYFNESSFDNLAKMYNFHPLIMAVGYARKNNTSTFYADDLAKSNGQNEKVVRTAMQDLMGRGFVDYDSQTGQVTLRRRAYLYVLSKAKRVDHDDIMLPSIEAKLPNATLRLSDKEITLRGIDRFYISNTLNVYIKPKDKEVILLGNRNFKFDGTLYSGNLEFVGKNFTFNYDSFLVNLPIIDSISFYIADEKGNRKKVDNTLQSAEAEENADVASVSVKKTSGTLYINMPDNKSARQIIPQYPKFNATDGAIVYFNGKNVLDGAYDKSTYFAIPPFAMDSLNNIDNSVISFKGTLYSDILPPIDETLRIMPDNSMGFEHKIPEAGYALYNGTATLSNQLRLDANGLRANGTIHHLTSTLSSQDFILYPDSVIAKGDLFDMQAGALAQTSFPQAHTENYDIRWMPQLDSMYLTNKKDKPFQLYDQAVSLDGELVLTSKGLLGGGKLLAQGSEAISKDMSFKQYQYAARHADFDIKSSNPDKPVLAGNDVLLDFDLQKNTGKISPEVEGVAAIEFPYAQFKTSITEAIWDLKDETVKMSKPKDVDISNSYFYATRKELDSLVFNAEEAIYRIPLLQLDVSGVPYIQVADAKITPENNKVQILENATFETFKNASLVIDTVNEYHKLYNGTIDVLSRNEFKGKATYELVSAADTFAIEMTDFHQEEMQEGKKKKLVKHTIAQGEVQESQNIIISPGMLYRGKVNMEAQKEALELDGEVKLDFKKIPNYDTWISYQSEAGQKKLEFNFEQSVTDQGEPLVAGLHLSSADNSLYTTFVTQRRSPDDMDIFKPSGLLSYDEDKQEYAIRDPKKYKADALSGKVFTYNENTQTIGIEGPVSFLPEAEKGLSVRTAVLGKGNLEKNEFTFDAFMALNIDLPQQAVDLMGADLDQAMNKSGAPAASNDRSRLLYKLAEIVGDVAAKAYDKSSVTDYTPLASVSKELVKTLVISDVTLQWSDEHKAWYSTTPLGISNVSETDVNGALNGFLEIKPTEEGTMLNIFMQATADSWYYFTYQNSRMGIWAYNEKFCDVIGSKSNINKAKPGDFAFYLSDIAETLNYVNRFRKTYLGIDEPYNLDIAPAVIAGEEKATPADKEAERDGF